MSPRKAKALQQPLPDPGGPKSSPKTNWTIFLVGVIVFTVAMMFVSFPVGLYTVFGAHLSNNYTSSSTISTIGLDLLFATVRLPVFGNLGGLFFVFSAIYFGFLLLAARQGAGLLRALRATASDGYGALFTNPLTATVVLLGATSLVTVLVDSVQAGAGVSTGSLTGDPLVLLVNFTLAPLLEETTFRLILIGVPVLILSLIMFRELSPLKAAKALWRPSSVWDVDEDEEVATARFEETSPSLFPDSSTDSLKVRAIRPVVYVFLALSSFIFGYAHYASGVGWGPGKVSEAAFAGLALGYLYVKYGFQTNVLLHWSINYVGSIFSFFAQAVYGIPWTSNSGSFLDVIPTLDIVFLLGVPSTLILANELVRGATRSRQPGLLRRYSVRICMGFKTNNYALAGSKLNGILAFAWTKLLGGHAKSRLISLDLQDTLMEFDEKIRYATLAVTVVSLVSSALALHAGVHLGVFDTGGVVDRGLRH